MKSRIDNLTTAQQQALKQVGDNIQLAIRRRRLRRKDVAIRAGVSEPTLRSLIRGEPGVRVSTYVLVLSVLGLLDGFTQIASAEHDETGLSMEKRHLPQRARLRESRYDF